MESARQSIRAGFAWLGSSVALIAVMDAVALAAVLMHVTDVELGTVALALGVAKVVEAIGYNAFAITAGIVQADSLSETQKHTSVWYGLGVGALVAVLLVLLALPLEAFFDAPGFAAYLWTLAPRSLLLPVWAVIVAFLDRDLRFASIANIRTGSSFVAAAARGGLSFSLGGAWAMAISLLLQAVFMTLLAFVLSGYRPGRPGALTTIRGFIRFGAPLTLAEGARALLNNLDYFLIGKFLGEAAVGLYRIAFELAVEIANPILRLVQNATRPVLARLKNDRPAYFETFLWFPRVVLLAFGALSAFIYWGAPDALALLAKGDMNSAPDALRVTRLLVFVALGRVIFDMLPLAFVTSDKPGEVLRFELLALALMGAGLSIGLWRYGPTHGVDVAAWTWIAVYPVVIVAVALRARKVLGMPLGAWARSLALGGAGVLVLFTAGAVASACLGPAPHDALAGTRAVRLLAVALPVLGVGAAFYGWGRRRRRARR